MRLTLRVLDGDGVAVDDAMLEVWQADADGVYGHLADEQSDKRDVNCVGFGRLATDKNGSCVFETIKPGRVPADDERLQAPHLNVWVFGRGILKGLPTRIYFAGDPANDECPILCRVPEDRRGTLLAQPDPENAGDWQHEIHLCGPRETVFFDL